MGKKARKTRWRKLPIQIGTGSSTPPAQGNSGGSHHYGHHQQGGHQRWRQHQQRHHSVDSTEGGGSGIAEDEVRNSTVMFNEDEYTKITTPRQDMLFKKGYLNKKKQPQESVVNNTSADSHSQDCLENEQYLCDDSIGPPPALTQYIYPGYLDPSGLFYINSSYEVYDPYTGNVTVIVGGPPLQPAHPVSAPIHPGDWMAGGGHLQPVAQRNGHQHVTSNHKPQSPDSQNCCSPAESSISGGTCSSPQPQMLSSSSPLEEEVTMVPTTLPSEHQDLEEVQHLNSVQPHMYHQHQYLYPGYMFGTPLYTMNGLSVQHQGVMIGAPPHPGHHQQRVPAVPAAHPPPIESAATASAGFYAKQKRKKRRRRKRGGVTDEGSESSCEEQQARCCGSESTTVALASCGSAGDSATATCSGSDSGGVGGGGGEAVVAVEGPGDTAVTPRSPSPASSLKESADSGVQSGDNSSGGLLGEARSPSPHQNSSPSDHKTYEEESEVPQPNQLDDSEVNPEEFVSPSEDSDASLGTELSPCRSSLEEAVIHSEPEEVNDQTEDTHNIPDNFPQEENCIQLEEETVGAEPHTQSSDGCSEDETSSEDELEDGIDHLEEFSQEEDIKPLLEVPSELDNFAGKLVHDAMREAVNDSGPGGGLPITEAVTKWLRSQRPESWAGDSDDPDEEEEVAEDNTTGPKNVDGNPYSARCRNARAELRVATSIDDMDEEEETVSTASSAANHEWQLDQWCRHDLTARSTTAKIIKTAVRIGPLPCAVCCLIQ